MSNTAWTTEDYNALCAAIATGAKAVKYSDKEIVYRTYDEMKRLKADMEAALNINQKSNRRVGVYCKP